MNILKRLLGIDEIEIRLKRLESFATSAENNFKGVAQLIPDIRVMDQKTYDWLRDSGQLHDKTLYIISED